MASVDQPKQRLTKNEELPEGLNLQISDEALYVYKNYNQHKIQQRDEIRKCSVRMPEWPITEDIVVSGMSGRFPECDSVEEYARNLYNNIDMVVEDERRWPFGYLGLPRGSGKIKDIASFDNEFFNVSDQEANLLDSQIRILLEITFEALWDAGIVPSTLAGSNTGVFLGHCFDEFLSAYADEGPNMPDYRQCFFAALHQRFDLRGPAKHFDSACASGFSAMHEAVVSLRAGECDRAIVVGLNICLRAGTQHQFLNLNMLSVDGHCKCLDDDANGYAKGEACVAVILQRKSEAKRIYATIVHTKTNCDGYKELGITFPSFEIQRDLIQDTYQEAGLSPLDIKFCEAHCTGTQAGDPSEMRAIVESMCANRTEPLLVGAIKSVIGHTEAASGICSLIKAILSFENEMIPANLHMNKINHRIEGLVSGQLKPIIENTVFREDLIALNCFGFGGVNVHAIIRRNQKDQNDQNCQESKLPRLVTFCGRNPETLDNIHTFIVKNPEKVTPDFLALLNEVSKTSPYPDSMMKGMRHRAYTLLTWDQGEDQQPQRPLLKSITKEYRSDKVQDKNRPPICFVFTGMGCQWAGMGRDLDRIPCMAMVLQRCCRALNDLDPDFDLMNILTNHDDPKLVQTITNSFVSIAAIQMALVELLKVLNIEPDFIVGHSIGELTCAYADGCLTLEETIVCAYVRGKCVEETLRDKPGKMAALGCTWPESEELLEKFSPQGNVWPACHNSLDSVTIAGHAQDVQEFLLKIQQNCPDLFARPVNSSNVAFHCPLVECLAEPLLVDLQKLIPDCRISSQKWLSSTCPDLHTADVGPFEFNAKFLVDNLILPVRFYEAFQRIPADSVFVELAPHNLLQSVIKRNVLEKSDGNSSSSSSSIIKYAPTLTRPKTMAASPGEGSGLLRILLENIGQLYLYGLDPRIENLYPKVEYPVSRGTASLHSIIKWKHEKKFKCTLYPEFFNHAQKLQTIKTIDLQHDKEKFYADHCIDGRILFPATGYLYLAWEIVAKILKIPIEQLPIVFEDIVLHRATIMPKSGMTDFSMKFNEENGHFVIMQAGTITTTGVMKFPTLASNTQHQFLVHQHMLATADRLKSQHECRMEMKTKDVYKEFRLRGYDYGQEFQTIQHFLVHDRTALAKISFRNWVTFVDGMIQTAVIGRQIRGLFVPVRLKYLGCDPAILAENLQPTSDDGGDHPPLEIMFDGTLNIGVAPGVEFQGIKANLAPRKIHTIPPTEESYEFVPHDQPDLLYATSRCNSLERRTYLTERIWQYQNACVAVLQNQTPDMSLEEYETEISEPVLLKILQQSTSINDSTIPSIELDRIEEDLLFRTYLNEIFLRTQLETVTENILEPMVEILEVSQTPNIISDQVLKLISFDTFRMNFNSHLLHPSLQCFNQNQLEFINSQHEWLVEKSKFPTELADMDLVVLKDSSICPLLAKHEVNFESILESVWNCLKDNRFALILVRNGLFPVERLLINKLALPVRSETRLPELLQAIDKSPFTVIGHKSDRFGVSALFLRKIPVEILPENQYFINATPNLNEWFEELQQKLREVSVEKRENPTAKLVWLLAQHHDSGIIGLVNCLRREPLGKNVRCLINHNRKDQNLVPLKSPVVRQVVKMDLYLNAVDPDGSLGAYRHFRLPLNENEPVPVQHCYLNVVTRGDLSSLRWFESQHKYWPLVSKRPDQTLVTVYYAPLNFRDIMLATGKLPPDALPDDMGLDDCILGLEFAGRDENGNRVMGMVPSKGLASTVVMDNQQFLWPIPAQWSMEEACTVPVAYATAYYALIIRGKLQRKEKVLIHSGSGAVGQAAIAICLDHDCHLFITCGSAEKREFLMQKFPQLKPNQFASSRDTDFERIIFHATNGRGVDVVLNSLAEEKLHASINCLGRFGRFLEIGKFDLSQDNKLNLSDLMQNKTFHGILLDNLFNFGSTVPKIIERHRRQIRQLINDGIEKGVVQPLNRTIFPWNKCEEAFRFMASGKHTGKVVICIRQEEDPGEDFARKLLANADLKIPSVPRTVFDPRKSYIITGGLGGFGLELINWMLERDARKFVITSRNGVKDLYQKTRLDYFQGLGATVQIHTEDTATKEGVENLVDRCLRLGPLGGVFHLAMVLNDGLLENQTLESFENVVRPKANTFVYMDQISRERSLNLDYFVAFSSVSCGLGNPGQTNYGYANSVMERVCDQRRRDGLHGFAIQWGAIGDVGYIIDNVRGNDIVVCGSIPQRIPSCLNALDRLLQSSFSVCSSLIKADYKFEVNCGKTSLIKTVAHILGIKDYDTIEPNLTLGELGMDSLMAVEVKQAVERDYEIVLSMQDIRKLTIGRIIEISRGKSKSDRPADQKNDNANELFDNKLVPIEPITYLNDILNGDPIIFLPQLDATYEQMLPIAQKLNRPVIGVNWTRECKDLKTVEETAAYFIQLIEKLLPNLTDNYDVIAYSFGGIIAIEMGLQLQQRKTGRLQRYRRLILLDSSPRQFRMYTEEAAKKLLIEDQYNDRAYVETIVMFLMGKLPIDIGKIRDSLLKMDNNQQRNQFVCDLFKQLEQIDLKTETLEFLMQSHYSKLLMMNQYECPSKQFQGDLTLIRASDVVLKGENFLKDDYWIEDIIDGQCNLHILKGDHKTFITDNYDELTRLIRIYV